MSFKFNWRFFDLEDLEAKCQKSLTESIAAVSRPPVIVKPMQVTAIEFGTVPPELAFHSIPSVSLKRAHVVFALKYSGDASLTLETSIEANPFREPYYDPELPSFVQPKVIAATDSLILPFRLKLKDIVLDTLVDVVYTPNGVLVNFHDDPVKAVGAESSLDMIPGVKQLLGSILRQSITASFYEDVPESVWTVSNPDKRAPDPWYGARRWSQHNKKFVRFASFIVNSLGAKTRQFQPKFSTLALNVETAELRLPNAILSRACLPRLQSGFENSAHIHNLSPQGLTSLFEAGSDVSSIRSSIATSSQSGRQRPKRRVVSLRQLQNKEKPRDAELKASPQPDVDLSDEAVRKTSSDQKPSQRTDPQSTGTPGSGTAGSNTPERQATNTSESPTPGRGTPSISTPKGGPQRNGLQSNSSHRGGHKQAGSQDSHGGLHNRALSNNGTLHLAAVESLTPPVFDSDDGATDTEQDLDAFGDSLDRLRLPDMGYHRRFSTPDESRIDRRRRLLPSKARTASMQPAGTTPLVQAPLMPSGSTSPHSLHTSRSPRSPRSRLVSTNDLMNK